MTNLILKLWELYQSKKLDTSRLIEENIEETILYFFSSQTAEMQLYLKSPIISHLSTLHGYLILRVLELVPEKEILAIRDRGLPEGPPERDDLVIEFRQQLKNCCKEEITMLNLIVFLKKRFFLAEYNEITGKLTISPPINQKNIQRAISFNLREEDQKWNDVFSPQNFPRSGTTFYLGRSSGVGMVTEEEITTDWAIFQKTWEKLYSLSLDITPSQFFSLWELVKWIHWPLPFNVNNASMLKTQLGLEDDNEIQEIFNILTSVLPEISNIKLPANINQLKENFLYKIFDIGFGWKLNCSGEPTHFHLACQFAANHFIRNCFNIFFEEKNNPGELYEDYLSKIINLFKSGNVKFIENRNSFLLYDPVIDRNAQEEHLTINLEILETNYEIKAPNVKKYGISEDGEIDLIIYSNKNIFILEAKSFFGRNTSHAFQSAAEQCTRYREWLTTDSFKKLITKKHKIKKWNRVFILIVTNRQEERLFTQCRKSKYYFANISFSMLPLLLLGIYLTNLPARNLVPSQFIHQLSELLEKNYQNFRPDISEYMNFENYRSVWRQYMFIILNAASLPKNYDFSSLPQFPFSAGYRAIDYTLGENDHWELEKEILVGENEGYRFYLITQLGNMKHSYVCPKCKSVWIYYFDGAETGPIYDILSKGICHKCEGQLKDQNDADVLMIRLLTGPLMIEFKRFIAESRIPMKRDNDSNKTD